MMIEDPEFIGDVKETIKSQEVNAEWAVKKHRRQVYRNV